MFSKEGKTVPQERAPAFSRHPADVIACPDPACRAPARIVARWTFGSTSGPVEQVMTACERGQWFTPLVESLDPASATIEASRMPVRVP
jgi:hypothetical protein